MFFKFFLHVIFVCFIGSHFLSVFEDNNDSCCSFKYSSPFPNWYIYIYIFFFSSIEFRLKFFSNDTWLYEVSSYSCLKVEHLKADKKLIRNWVHGKDFLLWASYYEGYLRLNELILISIYLYMLDFHKFFVSS